ncbi:MAG: hypothetical protein ACLP1X_01160 [Polyangiaceae bacterium]|jgi:hypothetical protein
MNEPDKIDPARAWLFAESLLAEEEAELLAESVEAMSDAEIEQEMRGGGYDPASVPTADEFVARGVERAAERERANEAREAAKVVALAERRRTRWVLTLIAAMFALFLVVMVKQGPAIVAFFKHEPAEIGPDNDWSPPKAPPAPTPAQKEAEALRDEAITECDHQGWSVCRLNLDYAQSLDPAGEDSPRVRRARSQLEEILREIDKGPHLEDKPPGK